MTQPVDFISVDLAEAISAEGTKFRVGNSVYLILKPEVIWTIKSFEINEECATVDVRFNEVPCKTNIAFLRHAFSSTAYDRINFISIDKSQALTSIGSKFVVGDNVLHDGAPNHVVKQIASFEVDVDSNEVLVTMTDGSAAHLDFLYKLRAIFRFNGGAGALLCSICSAIIKTGADFTELELQASRGEAYLEPQYCSKHHVK